MKTITQKLNVFLFFLLMMAGESWGQIYVHNFGTTTISTHPYTVVPTTLDANLSSSSWVNSTNTWTSFGGSSGQAISLNNSGGTPTITLTFNVNAGFQLQVNSYSFWRQRSNMGAQNYSMTINGNAVGSGTVPTTGVSIGTITTGLPISGITGTVTVVISLSGATGTGTFRLDDFTLNGIVTAIGPTLVASPTSLALGSTPFGTASASQNYSLSGSNLTGFPSNIVLTAPTGFEISLTNTTFFPSLNVPFASATLSATTIYARITSSASVGALSGNITHTGGGIATTFLVPLTGTVTPPTFSFSSATASIAENGGSINVTVNQSIANACNVNVALTGGTGVQGTDFTFTSPATLNFDGFITTQSLNIPIINNAIIDGNRTFILTLQTATGSCTIGTPTSITVTIINDDTVGTIFEKGDLAIVAFNTNDNVCSGDDSDFITFICFKDIIIGTTFDMTDNGWQRVNANQWGDSEGAVRCTYNGAATITAGTKITFKLPSIGSVPIATNWSFADLGSGATINMNSGGDQLYFMQGGAWNNPPGVHNATYTGGIILFGFNSESAWNDFVDNSGESGIYPNTRCFITSISAGNYTRYTGTATATTKRDWIDRISNVANWTTYANCTLYNAASSPNFVITAGTLVNGKWVGTLNTNWFDCKNWDDYLIPTATTNVTIALTTDNSPEIKSNATYASEFSGIAQCKDITIASSTTKILSFFATGTHNLEVYGNWDNQKGTANFTEGNGTINFKGTTAQTITTTGGTETFTNVILNNTAGLSLSNTNMLIASNLTFTNGIITANNATTARVEFLAGSSVTGAGTSKYVAGFVRKVGNTAFDFPVGDENYYSLVRISAPASITDHFTATYDRTYLANPYNSSAVKAEGALTLNHVDNCEYWDLQRTNGTSDVFITLAYEDTRSCKITNGFESDMRIAHWDGAEWENKGNSATNVISSTYGTITSAAAISSFSPFTLGSISIFNPLPIEIVSFDAKINQNNHAQLDWITVSELNAKGFDIEKSFDGKSFEKIGSQNALGGVDVIKNYQFFDKNYKNVAYYRLKLIDNNGIFKYSKIIYLNNQKTNTYQLTIIPNPTQGEVKLVLGNVLPTETVTLKVFSITGKEVISLFGDILEVEKQLSNQTIQLPAGMYVVRMQIGEQILQTKLIKN